MPRRIVVVVCEAALVVWGRSEGTRTETVWWRDLTRGEDGEYLVCLHARFVYSLVLILKVAHALNCSPSSTSSLLSVRIAQRVKLIWAVESSIHRSRWGGQEMDVVFSDRVLVLRNWKARMLRLPETLKPMSVRWQNNIQRMVTFAVHAAQE